MKTENTTTDRTNPDAITGAPGSHPGATAIGAASGSATGAALGAIGGPVGAIIGAVAGGIVGGASGHSIGEWNDPSDAEYWKKEYRNRSYYDQSADYDRDVTPALQYGSVLGASGSESGSFDSLEEKAMREWDKARGNSKFSYQQARSAISDAFNHKLSQHKAQLSQTSRDQVTNS